ncbi:hypothetical protein [Halopiger djelfimassiliensis]|uniref:hypothetical protein n=1 Tax=Halopiger djelfimassiliensis TaxID=1293047 RepID=UPI000AD53EC3|nr:hypothetical protein [Halopiger djelfimassiliensis]
MRNPDRIATAAAAIATLSSDRFEALFGDYYRQLRSISGDVSPVVEVPDAPANARVEMDIYLGMSDAETVDLVDQLATDGVLETLERVAERTTARDGGLMGRLKTAFAREDIDVSETAAVFGDAVLEAVGPVAVRWTAGGTEREVLADAAATVPDRDPDVRPQLLGRAYEFDDIEAFRRSLIRHLLCQVRDCYITMGIAPPEDIRVQGPGFYDAIGWYSNHDVYQNYHDPNATITDWQEEHTPTDLHL